MEMPFSSYFLKEISVVKKPSLKKGISKQRDETRK